MASVAPPPITYTTSIKPEMFQQILDEGRLSLAQLEAITYAGQAHQQMLPALEGGTEFRQGYFIGDGTGVGKGREVAGIIADNFSQGRTKAVWISEKSALIEDAKRDWQGAIDGDPAQIVPLGRFKVSDPIKLTEGILFTTYSTLRGVDKQDKTKTRVQQIVHWLGTDFDGVLIFDECVPAGTLIATSEGPRRIEDIKQGDMVLGVDHTTGHIVSTPVLSTFRRTTPEPFYTIGTTRMTGNHPVYTMNRGYVSAKYIDFGDTICYIVLPKMFMRKGTDAREDVYEDLRTGSLSQDVYQSVSQGTFLREELQIVGPSCSTWLSRQTPGQWELAKGHSKVRSQKFGEIQAVSQDAGISRFRAQSISESGNAREGYSRFTRKRMGQSQWWQWATSAVTSSLTCYTSRVVSRISDWLSKISRLSNKLQSRYCRTYFTDSDRGRWGRTQRDPSENPRCQEDQETSVFGLACAPLYERPHSDRSCRSDARDYGLREVFNIETGTANYFAEGLLVHNCHAMANNIKVGSGLTAKEASQQALAGLQLQNALPKARIVYLSATGATEVSNLGYLERLGLWGPHTPFADKQTFINQVAAGGVAAMELVARDLKAMGLYLSRSLSYDGVEYDRVESPLSEFQTEAYNRMALAWQTVLGRVNEALKLNDADKGMAKQAAINAFWSSHQRFFNQIITAMQTPAMLRGIEQDLARGDAVVIQLVNTNEANQKEKLSQMEEGDSLEDLSLTPLETLMQYVSNSFPVQQWETYIDRNGNEQRRPLLNPNAPQEEWVTYTDTDSVEHHGAPVQNPEAVALRDATLDELAMLINDIPDGPLEQILNHFGPEIVGEVTGRRERLVYRADAEGIKRRVREKRTNAMTMADAKDFMDDKKRILIFSDKGGTGRSYHADRTAINQRRRQHYVLQPGWRADKAVQGFGRTHRTNQASAPVFHLVTTDLPGQRRFISSVARRLDQLGALTRGQRQASTQGLFAERDNLESVYARDALQAFFRDLAARRNVSITLENFEQQTGLKLVDERTGSLRRDLPDIRQFLNRMLSMTVEAQHGVFNDFSLRLDQAIEVAMQQGNFDAGVETLKADGIDKKSEKVIATDPKTGSETRYVELLVRHRNHPRDWQALQERVVQLRRQGTANTGVLLGYAQNKQSGRVYALVLALPKTDTSTGNIVHLVRRVGVNGEDLAETRSITGDNYTKLDETDAQPLIAVEHAKAPAFREHVEHLFTGVLLPHWDKLPREASKVYRLQTDAGERLLGRVIAPKDLEGVLKNFGVSRTGGDTKPALSASQALSQILDARSTLRLANGWRLHPVMTGGEWRVELSGPGSAAQRELLADGALFERHGFRPRWFLPTGDRGVDVLRRITSSRAIVEEIPAKQTE
jgi:hypothetical protein